MTHRICNTDRLTEIRICHHVRLISLLVSRLEQSSYICSESRRRVVELVHYHMADIGTLTQSKIKELQEIAAIFGGQTHYIPRATIRKTVDILRHISRTFVPKLSRERTNWTHEEWFCWLTDSQSIVEPVQKILSRLGVCRITVACSSNIIHLLGETSADVFYGELSSQLCACDYTRNIPDYVVSTVFRYRGGVIIYGTTDALYR
jgi:hypothetical protein